MRFRWPPPRYRRACSYWAFLPDRLKFNRQLNRLDQTFINWDCSTQSFEGIRSQDILPLLIRQFGFSHFLGFGGLIDVFIDRGYGHNFDPKSESDCALIDFIHELNELTLEHDVIKPTMMFAAMTPDLTATTQCDRNFSPTRAVRVPPT